VHPLVGRSAAVAAVIGTLLLTRRLAMTWGTGHDPGGPGTASRPTRMLLGIRDRAEGRVSAASA